MDGSSNRRKSKAFPTTEAARALRQRSMPAEELLWQTLRDRQLAGMKFRRQRPFGPFVVDFVCTDHRLVVEVDGPIHDNQADQDAYRSEFIESYGFTVIRFRNDEVLTDLASILAKITAAAQLQRPAPPSPSDGRGGLGG